MTVLFASTTRITSCSGHAPPFSERHGVGFSVAMDVKVNCKLNYRSIHAVVVWGPGRNGAFSADGPPPGTVQVAVAAVEQCPSIKSSNASNLDQQTPGFLLSTIASQFGFAVVSD